MAEGSEKVINSYFQGAVEEFEGKKRSGQVQDVWYKILAWLVHLAQISQKLVRGPDFRARTRPASLCGTTLIMDDYLMPYLTNIYPMNKKLVV